MDTIIVGLLGIVLMLVLIAMGVYLALAMAAAGIVGLTIIIGFSPTLGVSALQPYSWVSMYALSAIPLFVLMGHFAYQGGVSRDLYEFAYKWVGRLPGGLAVASALGCAGFAAVTGSSSACCAMMGRVALPEMKKYGYQDGLATGSLAASGTLGTMIPPSTGAVVYAVVTNVSVGAVLIAGIIPGIISVVIYMVMIWVRATMDPSLGPPARGVSWSDSFRSIPKVSLPILVFTVTMGGIWGGFFTPTEGGAMGAFATFLIAIARKGMSWSNFKEALADTTGVVGMAFMLFVGASLFGMLITLSGIPTFLAEFFAGLELPRMAILILILVPFIPLGMFIDSLSMVLLTMPVLLPILHQYGFNLIWFSILVRKLTEIGLITPPVGINVYIIKALVPEVPLAVILKGILWFLVMDFLTLAILIAVPELSTWLPATMLK